MEEEKDETPAYGDKVLSFGPGGSGCTAPVAKFKANGVEGNVKVKQGETVSFDASGSELASGPGKTAGFRRELIWDFGDGNKETVKGVGEGEAPASTSHKYTSAGNFTAKLQIRLKKPDFGNPAPAEHAVEAEAGVSEFQLKVTKAGTGSGTVTSNPVGIACGAVCQVNFAEGTVVKLVGTPAPGSKAVVWSTCPGSVNGSNECVVTMSAAKEAVATFDLQSRLLKVTKAGSGSGTVTSSPAGINCGATCEANFNEGAVVKLTGAPDAGSKAVVWSGCDSIVGSNECQVTMSTAKNVVATFDLEQHLLKVTKAGSGAGTVTSSPAGINCGASCQFNFNHNALVKLSGAPEAGSKAVVWTGCTTVNGLNECEVTISAAKEVTASFDLQPRLLKVTKSGSGSGTVTSSPAGINCGATCQFNFNEGTVVKLTGAPDAGSKAVVWSGCDSIVGANECQVTMSAAKEVTATFALIPLFQLKVTKSGSGSGTVTSSPAGINCGADLRSRFAEATVVKLAGAPDEGSKAVVWSGCDSIVGSNECQVTMSTAKNVVANFELEVHQLKVTKSGSGAGTVTSSPAGINCGATCQFNFNHNALVKLTGAPEAGSKAVVWTGCTTVNGSNECEVTISAAKEVTATFALIPLFQLKVTKSGSGAGTVTSAPAGINCGATCQFNFAESTVVKLTGTPDPGSKAVVWSGCDSISGANECQVTMSAAKNVVASFDLEQHLLKVTKAGSGAGTVTSSPAGINCGAGCEASFNHGTLVKLSGSPEAGSQAVVWTGCDTVNGSNQCEVTISAAKEVTATFSLAAVKALIVTKAGSGSGTVTSSPAGINCGSECSHEYTEGTSVDLAGASGANTKAVVWSGCDSIVGSNECRVTMSAAKNVVATFDLEQHLLKVTKAGSGAGTVTSSPAGINCGATCQFNFNHNALVKLSGAPEAGSKAVVWTGCTTVNGSNECEVTISAAKEVTATFALIPLFQLKVTKSGSGAGTVTSAPAGINCGSTCQFNFAESTVVKLTGTPDPGSKAVVWSGCDSIVGANECQVTMSAAKNVIASFDLEQHLLKVTKAGSGAGTVTSSPAGINCGAGCEASFNHGTLVKLSGSPEAGSQAVVWTGCDTVNGSNQCEVTVGAAKEVTATFSLTAVKTLTVTKAGSGAGAVTSAPAGINCGATCQFNFAESTVVKLTGTPDPGSKAVVWSGCDSIVGANECQVTMSAAKNVTATFDLEQRLLKVTKAGSGSGTVTSSPAGINCGSTCEANFNLGAVVKLSGAPTAGSKAVVWTTCPGIVNGSNQCEVTMGAAKEAVAGFDLEQHSLRVIAAGSGSGTVTSSPAGINCGSTCEADFNHGTLVKLTGAPAGGSQAVVWTGCDTVNGSNECEVAIGAAKDVTATFSPQIDGLKVTKAGSGAGTVVSAPAGIECGASCEASFAHGTLVKLSGTPGSGSKAVVWSGCDTVNGSNECEVTIGAAVEVTASFDLEQHPLKVTKEGTGTGTVTSSPAGINCGASCEASFNHGTLVKLSGAPDAGSKAVVWTTCPGTVNGSNQCEVTIGAAKEAVAGFDLMASASLTVSRTGNGSGVVKSTGSGIDCGADCSETYLEGATVVLSAGFTAGTHTDSVQWAGCTVVTGANQCEVVISGAKTVTADFKLEQHRLTVTKAGSGAGWVASAPAGIGCGGTCTADFDYAKVVILTGTAGAGTDEVVWSGCDGVIGSNRCEVKLESDRQVGATFAATATTLGPEEVLPEVEEPADQGKKKQRKKKHKTARQKALAKCKKLKLKGKARAKCVKRANAKGKHHKHKRSGSKNRGGRR